MPVNDVDKRKAILDKMSFDVTKAIEIKNMKYDGDTEEDAAAADNAQHERRVHNAETAGRRVQPPKYNVVQK